MPVRRREAGQVRVKGIVIFMFRVRVCFICLVLVGLIFLQRMFDVGAKMSPEEK